MAFVLRLSLWLGVVSLYFGFAGVLGLLLRRAVGSQRSRLSWLLPAAHGGLLFLPASVVILDLPGWHLALRLVVLAFGVGLVWMAAAQPRWLPASIWQRAFGHRYFAGAMACAALWGVGLALSAQAVVPIVVGAAATFAGAASLYTTPPSEPAFRVSPET